MKKYLSLILALILLASSFAACGDDNADNNDSSKPADESVISNTDSDPATSAPDESNTESNTSVSNSGTDTEASESTDEPNSSATDESKGETNDYKPIAGDFSFPNGLIIVGDRCMESFGGSYDNANLYYQYVTEHKDKLGDNVNVYSMVVPTASSIYLQELVIDGEDYYKKYGGNQVDKLSYLDELFEADGKVESVNVYDELFAHWDEQIYYRTDWHWTQLGAFYAAQAFAEQAGLDMPQLNSGYYKKEGKYNADGSPMGFLGSLYAYADRPQVLANSPDEFFWYEFNHEYTVDYYDRETGKSLNRTRSTCYPSISDSYVSSWYMTFLDADNNLCKINNPELDNDKVAVVFKDSFGNCFAPLLTSMFETVYVVDFRYFTGNSATFCKDVGATDVMFVLSSFSAMGSNCLNIGKMVRR